MEYAARMFWPAMVGAFIGKVLAALFIAICLTLGFGPDQWADLMIIGLPGWATPERAQFVFIILGVLGLLGLVGPWLLKRLRHSRPPDMTALWVWSGFLFFVGMSLGMQGNELLSRGDKPPLVTIRDGLYVGEIRLTFGHLQNDRHSELIMRVFNCSGSVVELSSLGGQVKFHDANDTDPDRMRTLPLPTLGSARTVSPFQEWLLILNQQVPAVEADKLLAMFKDDIQIHFDLSGLKVEVVGQHDRNEVERIPIWRGVTYSRGIGFVREVFGDSNIRE